MLERPGDAFFYVLVVPEKSTAPRRVYVYNFRTLPARAIMYVRQIHFHVASEKKVCIKTTL